MAARLKAPKANGGILEVPQVTNGKRIRAENIGPIHDFEDTLHVGINQLAGGQGVGKSHLVAAFARAMGADMPVSVHDGENEAKLIVDGVPILEVQRKKGKAPHVSLASVSPAALVVDPGIKDPASREEARLKNLLKMVRAESTEQMVEFFLTPEPKDIDDYPEVDCEAYDYVDKEYGVSRLVTLDPVAVADVLIKGSGGLIHKLKRAYRDRAEKADARYQVASPEKPARLSELNLEEADADYQRAVGDLREAQGSWQQREARERERAAITLGERPDVALAEVTLATAHENLRLTTERVIELEKQLAIAKAEQATRIREMTNFANILDGTKALAQRWDKNKALLETPITGSTAEDVQTSTKRVVEARAALDLARETAHYQKGLDLAETARKERDQAQARESEVAKLADGIPARLGAQFERCGIPGARVNAGVLQVKNEQERWEDFERRSVGQQWRWVLPIDLARNPGGIIAHLKESWNELEHENQVEVAQAHVDFDCIGIVEVTTHRGDPLHVEQFVR